MSETPDSILPCPICSAVVRRPDGSSKSITEVPMLHHATMKSTREGRDWFVWDGCRHTDIDQLVRSSLVEDSMRSLAIARWNVHARKLYAEKIVGWSEKAADDFGRALGFVS